MGNPLHVALPSFYRPRREHLTTWGLFPREPPYPLYVPSLHRANSLASLGFPLVAGNLHDNGVEVQNFLKSYNAEMGSRGVNEALRLEYFCQVVAEPIYKEMKKHQEAHDSWVSFEEALREAYGYKEQKGRGLYEFDQWISSKKTHQTAMDAFVEFESRFAQLTERDQRLVGVDKALLFIKSIDRRERNSIGIQLEDDDGANGLTENWAEVERVCRRYDKRKMGLLSTTSRPMRNNQRGTTCDNTKGRELEVGRYVNTRHRSLHKGDI